jgi:hypothetical protein
MLGFLNLSKHAVVYLLISAFGVCLLSWILRAVRKRSHTTPLKGPPAKSFLFGLSSYIESAPDGSVFFEQWAKEYGSAYHLPGPFGSSQVVLNDPKALATFYARESWIYLHDPIYKGTAERLVSHPLFHDVI